MRHLIKKLLRERLLSEGLLSEGASPVLYHFTRLSSVTNILDNNALYLTTNVGTKSDQIGGGDYFISFTRTKSNRHGYGAAFTGEGSVRITVDGKKLNQNHKVVSVDYWQTPRTAKNMRDSNTDEMEERVLSNNNEIPNANNYIIAIDIFSGESGIPKTVIDNCEKLGIKLNVFNNAKDFSSGRPERAVEPIVDTNVGGDNDSNIIHQIYDLVGALTYNSDIKNEVYSELKGMGVNDFEESVAKYHDKLDYYLRPNDDYNLTDLSNSLGASIQNSMRNPNKVLRYILKELTLDFRRTKSKGVKDYLNKKIYVGKKTQEDYNKVFNDKLMSVIDKSFKENIGRLDYSVYGIDGESEYRSIADFPPVNEFLISNITKIKKYVSDYVLTNDDMFKYAYVLSSSEVKDKLDLKRDNQEATRLANQLQDVNPSDIMQVLDYVIYDIDNFYYDEVDEMKKEEQMQWKR